MGKTFAGSLMITKGTEEPGYEVTISLTIQIHLQASNHALFMKTSVMNRIPITGVEKVLYRWVILSEL